VRFLLDMGLSPLTTEFLRGHGHEASHLRDQGLQKMADPDILEKAKQEQCVLLTHDLDFADLLAANREALPSVVLFRIRSMRPENVHRYLEVILNQHLEGLARGAILTVTDAAIRSRPLPIASAGSSKAT
jgi:predicted nuclease of predicted toxin-antitoxin system